ncbi:MAG: DUF2314 domain-containing protein [Verrucomicrobiales bacterium]|nr:DUF2314 domain-containing protein [Verrucomicrobiales bacterium]
MKILPLLLFTSLFLFSCEQGAEPETLVRNYDESGMDAAIARARAEVDQFLVVLEKGDADSFSVKAPIKDENGTEHFWFTDVTFADGQFTGSVGNDPGIVQNVQYGQPWTIEKGEISDWMFTRGEKIHGGYTIDPLLDSYPEEEAEVLRAKLVR